MNLFVRQGFFFCWEVLRLNNTNCDFSFMREEISEGLQHLTTKLQHVLSFLDGDDCILCNLEEIREELNQLESVTGSYYLKCYLSNYTEKVDDFSLCLKRLSARRHGALIVVQGIDDIDSIIQKGTEIEALFSSSLVESIFYPGNPLHDGAVLIREDTIVSAANILPLTTTNITGRKMGTRHRAALGITESSDALALVVSEETGKVSFAIGGSLYLIQV